MAGLFTQNVNSLENTGKVRQTKKKAAGGGAGRRGHGVMEVQLETRRLWGAPSLEHYEGCQQQSREAIGQKVHFRLVPTNYGPMRVHTRRRPNDFEAHRSR
jgi:hypothetical protein